MSAIFTLLGALLIALTLGNAASLSTRTGARIVGGKPASELSVPYIVSLVTHSYHICGGSILNHRTVITAAHCLAYVQARQLQVHAGAKTRSHSDGVMVGVREIYFHQGWTAETMDYDMGVVRLDTPLSYGPSIQPIALPQRGSWVRDGSMATVFGWGFVNVIGPESEILRYAQVPIIRQRTCKRMMPGAISERMICAGYAAGGIDACQMDSGGPLVLRNQLVGIVSWGIGCALPNKPGIYTRVTALLPWLEDLMDKEFNETISV